MKVKYIIMKMVDDRAVTLRDVAAMGAKDYRFFEQVLANAEGNFFLAGELKGKLMDKLHISYSTYWSRVHSLEEKSIIKRTSRGLYKLNTNWVKVFDVDPKK